MSNELCSNCSKLDVRALFFSDRHPHVHFEKLRTFVGNLGAIIANPSCPLCRIISHTVSSQAFKELLQELELSCDDIDCYLEPWRADAAEGTDFLARDAQELTATSLVVHLQIHAGEKQQDLEFFHPVDIKLHHTSAEHNKRPLLNGCEVAYPVADLGLVNEWLRKCERLHGDTCGNLQAAPNNLDPAYRRSFRLIDVASRKLQQIDPSEVEYAALSYVWGYSHDQYLAIRSDLKTVKTLPATLLTTLPGTIQDAMVVCSQLDIQYIWVDLFCIDQTPSAEQKTQLRNMGNTYQRAAITIIAAYGEDSHAGLPGVKDYPPNAILHQCREQVAGLELITGLPTLSDQINDSKWGTRGWTFQEGLLSTRCLIFGGYEPIYYCRKQSSRQSLRFSPIDYASPQGDKVLNTTMGQLEHFPLSTTIFSHRGVDGDEWTFGDYTQIVKGYLLRDLSFTSDTLPAISGYLDIVTQRVGVKFIWGLPAPYLLDGLAWYGRCYSWNRLEEAPTWSWAGWGMSWHNWPFFESARYNDNSPTGAEDYLPSCTVHLSGDDYPEHRIANRVLQYSAIVSVCPGYSQRRLRIESYVATFEVEPFDLEQELQYDGDEEAPLTTPELTIVGENGPVAIRPANSAGVNADLNEFKLSLPFNISHETFQWIMTTKMEFLLLKRWEEVMGEKIEEVEEDYEPFNYVLAMLIDRREGEVAQRLGLMAIPVREWDSKLAGARKEVVFLE